MKLLITDDEYATRSTIRHLLKRSQIQFDLILEAENYEEAITQIIQHNPEIVITDIVMPLHDGIYLMDWILKHAPQSKIIAISGYDNFSYVKSALQKGCVDYLLKPLDPSELNRALTQAIALHEKEIEYLAMKTRQEKPASEISSCHPVMLEVRHYIDSHYCERLRQQDIADFFYINREYLSRKFKQEFHVSMVDYINTLRIEKAKELLAVPGIRIADISGMLGFTDEKYFSTVFKKACGVSPKTYYMSRIGAKEEG